MQKEISGWVVILSLFKINYDKPEVVGRKDEPEKSTVMNLLYFSDETESS